MDVSVYCVCLSMAVTLCLSLLVFQCLFLPWLSLSSSYPSPCLCVSLCLPHCPAFPFSCLRVRSDLPTLSVRYKENTEQSLLALARSLTAGANNEKFRINWTLIICRGGNADIYTHIYETKANLATVTTAAHSNKAVLTKRDNGSLELTAASAH